MWWRNSAKRNAVLALAHPHCELVTTFCSTTSGESKYSYLSLAVRAVCCTMIMSNKSDLSRPTVRGHATPSLLRIIITYMFPKNTFDCICCMVHSTKHTNSDVCSVDRFDNRIRFTINNTSGTTSPPRFKFKCACAFARRAGVAAIVVLLRLLFYCDCRAVLWSVLVRVEVFPRILGFCTRSIQVRSLCACRISCKTYMRLGYILYMYICVALGLALGWESWIQDYIERALLMKRGGPRVDTF